MFLSGVILSIFPSLDISNIILAVSICSGTVAIIIGRNVKGLLWYYAWSSFIADVIGQMQNSLNVTKPHYWNSNLFLLCELLLVSSYLIGHSMTGTLRTISKLAVYFLALIFVISTFLNSYQKLNYQIGSWFYVFFVVLLIWAFYKVVRDIDVIKIERSPFFIFCSGFLLFIAGSLILMLVWDDLLKINPKLEDNLKIVRRILNILKNATVAYSLYLYGRPNSQSK